jgi:hypothetical protein
MGAFRIVVPLCFAVLLDGTVAFRAPASLPSARLGLRPATCAARPSTIGLRMGTSNPCPRSLHQGCIWAHRKRLGVCSRDMYPLVATLLR